LSKIEFDKNDQRIINEERTNLLSGLEMDCLDFSCNIFGKFSKLEVL
jgi:hypothetical protein